MIRATMLSWILLIGLAIPAVAEEIPPEEAAGDGAPEAPADPAREQAWRLWTEFCALHDRVLETRDAMNDAQRAAWRRLIAEAAAERRAPESIVAEMPGALNALRELEFDAFAALLHAGLEWSDDGVATLRAEHALPDEKRRERIAGLVEFMLGRESDASLRLRPRFRVWAKKAAAEIPPSPVTVIAKRLGVYPEGVSAADAARWPGAIRVADVVPESAAARAGIQTGDILWKWGAVQAAPNTAEELETLIYEAPLDADIPVILVSADGAERAVIVRFTQADTLEAGAEPGVESAGEPAEDHIVVEPEPSVETPEPSRLTGAERRRLMDMLLRDMAAEEADESRTDAPAAVPDDDLLRITIERGDDVILRLEMDARLLPVMEMLCKGQDPGFWLRQAPRLIPLAEQAKDVSWTELRETAAGKTRAAWRRTTALAGDCRKRFLQKVGEWKSGDIENPPVENAGEPAGE